MTPFEWAIILVALVIRGIYRLLTGAAAKEREEERRLQEQLQREEAQRRHQERLRREVEEEAKKQFEQVVMSGRFPSDKVLATLANCDSDIPVNTKEALEELLYGRCSLHTMTFSHAVASLASGSASKIVPRQGLPEARSRPGR